MRDKRKYLNKQMSINPNDGLLYFKLISVNTEEKVEESTTTPRNEKPLLLAISDSQSHVPLLEMSTERRWVATWSLERPNHFLKGD